MPVRLSIRYKHAAGWQAHRLLKTAKVEVTAGGSALAALAGSGPGDHRFDVPDAAGTKVEVTFAVSAGETRVLSVEQALEVVSAEGAPTLRPVDGRFKGLHPLLSHGPAAGAGSSKKRGGLFSLQVDTTFLDVSDHATKRGVRAWDAKQAQAPGLELRMLEYTGPAGPRVWLALLPQALRDDAARTEVPALVFFRPTNYAYGNVDDEEPITAERGAAASYVRALRYLFPPAAAGPFYVSEKRAWTMYTNCGWAKQLVQSKKPVLLVMPLPNYTAYGVLEATTEAHVLVASLVRALWAGGQLGKGKKEGVKLGRLGMSGYSYGGGQLLKALQNNAAHVDEAYLFDPNGFPGAVGQLEAWFKAKAGRKLRMLGGFSYNLAAMLKLKAKLGAGDDVSVAPPSADFWHDDPLYKAAATRPGKVEAFDPVGATPAAGSLSADTGIFIVPPAPPKKDEEKEQEGEQPAERPRTRLEARWTDASGKVQTSRHAVDGSPVEAAGIVRYEPAMEKIPLPITSAAAMARVVGVLAKYDGKPRIPEMRHGWPVIGGVDTAGATDRGTTFKGFLQQCLETSGFG